MAAKKPSKKQAAEAMDLAASLRKQKTLTGLGSLCEKMIDKFGGEDGFAEVFYETFNAEDTTSATKARMLGDITGLQTQLARHAADQSKDDLGYLDDADLAAALLDAGSALTGTTDDDAPEAEVAPAADPLPPQAEAPSAGGTGLAAWAAADAPPAAEDLAGFFERPTSVIPPDPREVAGG